MRGTALCTGPSGPRRSRTRHTSDFAPPHHKMIGLTGYDEDRPDDPMTIVSGALLDQPLLQGPIAQQRREDLQLLNFLQGVTAAGATHPIEIQRGDEPPDRYLTMDQRRWAVELTEFTLEDLRADLAQFRSLGRKLELALENSAEHNHLRGRVVQLQLFPAAGHKVPKGTHDLEVELKNALAVDRGFFGEGVDLSGGAPAQIPVDRGNYGQIGSASVLIGEHGAAGKILVSASVQTEIYESSVMEALGERIDRKDHHPNEILVVSTGLPDDRGYTCPVEAFMFQAILDAKINGRLESLRAPKNLVGVVLHSFSDARRIEIFRNGDEEIPWPPPTEPTR
jgi:hypothetical protein